MKICSCSLLYKCVCVVCQTIMQFEPNNEFNSVLFHLSSLSNCSFCCSFLSSSFFLWFLLNGIFTTTILLFTPARACNSFQVCVGRMFSHMIFHFTKFETPVLDMETTIKGFKVDLSIGNPPPLCLHT